MRDAQRGDARAIGEIWAGAVPYLVRSPARASADLREDKSLGRRRFMALVGDVPAGTATARTIESADGSHEVFLSVEVHPELGSRGVGTTLLATAAGTFPGAAFLRAVSNDDPIAMAFAVSNGFLPEGEHQVAVVDTASVAAPGPVPDGLRALSLDTLPDLRLLMQTYNVAAFVDPSGLTRPFTLKQLRADWWSSPDNAPELSWGLLAPGPSGAVLAAFTSVQVDRARGRSWSSMTATHPDHRGRGLASWVKRRMLAALHDAGLPQAWTANDFSNASILAVNASLGYRHVARSVRVGRRGILTR